MAKGRSGLVCAVDDSDLHARTLRRMGLREGARVEVLNAADPVLIRCEGCCLAIGRCMLQGISILDSQEPDFCDSCPERIGTVGTVSPVRAVRPVGIRSTLGEVFRRFTAGLAGMRAGKS